MTEPTCAACGAAARAGAKFCSECGTPLGARCPGCGADVGGGRFCSECGTPLEAAAPTTAAASPSQPVTERRLVSLLFADLVGFTTLSETWDAEAVRELQSAYFDRARTVVERYGGTIEKFIGDAVCAIWGVPTAHEDDAERAVRAGLDLLSAIATLRDEMKVPELAMRVGITTGQVAVALGAVGEGMVTGDAVNTAARVQSVAAAGQVWVDDTTRSLTTASLAYQPVGVHELKGKSTPTPLFRALRTTAVVGGEQRVDGLEAPFVGRDREFRLVKELFHDTVEEGRARLVLVAGEPGIGKSRLAWEFEKYLDGIRSQTSYWLRGRCLSYGSGVAGRVVAEMVRSVLRVTDTDPDERIREALEERLVRHVEDPAERDVLRPRLASLLGLTDQVFDRADLFACWRAFFEALTHDASAVTLVVEDLQWADDGFLDFVDHLLEASHSPIMVLALARPEIRQRRAGIGAGRRETTVFLEPLRDEAMGALLDGLVGDLPPQLRDELVRRAEGVPLYAVETVRSLIDRDVVVPSEGRYVVDTEAARRLKLTELAPPASLQALLSARLDALSPEERRIVQDASVLGLTFTSEALRAVISEDVDVDAGLDSLRRKEILTIDVDPRSPERGQLRFVQALLRSVAYETLSRRDRKARHIAVAGHLAQLPEADSIASVLAAHYLDAAVAVEDAPDTTELHLRAADMLERAAEHAVGIGAPVDAMAHYERLLALDLPDETVLRVTMVGALLARQVAAGDRGLQWAERGLALAEERGREDDVLAFRTARAELWVRRGEHLQEAMAEACEVFNRCEGRPERVRLLAQTTRTISIASQAVGESVVLRDIVIRAIDDIERYGDDSEFHVVVGVLSMWSGVAGYRRLTAMLREAQVGLHDDRDPAKVIALSNVAAAAAFDDPSRARLVSRRALDLAHALGIDDLAPQCHLINACVLLGEFDEAESLLAERRSRDRTEFVDWEAYIAASSAVLAWFRGDPDLVFPEVEDETNSVDPTRTGWILMRHAVTQWLSGRPGDGLVDAVHALERMSGSDAAQEDAPSAYALALDMALRAGDLQAVAGVTDRLEQLSRGRRFHLMHGQLLRCGAHRKAGVGDDPQSGLREAIRTFDEMGAAYWATVTRVELAAAQLDAGQSVEAMETLDAAEGVLRRLRAVPLLDRVTQLRAGTAAVNS